MAPRGSSVPNRGQTRRVTRKDALGTPRGFIMRAICGWCLRHLLLAIPAYFRAKRRLSEEIEDAEHSYEKQCQELDQVAQRLDGNAILRHQESAAQRLRSIEDKARSNLLGITIGIAVLFSGFNLAAGGGLATLVPEWVRAPLLFLLTVAVCYLLTGGAMALNALRLMPVVLPSFLEEVSANKHMRTVQAIWALEQNESKHSGSGAAGGAPVGVGGAGGGRRAGLDGQARKYRLST